MTARADLHCHSSASQVSKLGVQRALGLPECATPPEAVYALAKRRGMDFVTITDQLNQPAAVYVETRGGTGVGGSDDHAGVDIGRTWSETPAADDPRQFLAHVRAGRVWAGGDHGSAAKWAHAALAIALRTLGRGGDRRRPDPVAVMRMAERIMSEADVRSGALGTDLGPDDARALLQAWLSAVHLDLDERELLDHLQGDGFRHEDLARRARRSHERGLRDGRATRGSRASSRRSSAPSTATARSCCRRRRRRIGGSPSSASRPSASSAGTARWSASRPDGGALWPSRPRPLAGLPPDRTLQRYETAIHLALSLGLAGFCAWWLRHRVT